MKNDRLTVAALLVMGLVMGAGCRSQKPTKLTSIPGLTPVVQNPTTTTPTGPVIPSDMGNIEFVARHLISQPSHLLYVEGHCDERGTEQYNLSLGERRAQAVRDQLMAFGISSDRVQTISYGEKQPVVEGGDEASYQANRRGEFVLMSQPGR